MSQKQEPEERFRGIAAILGAVMCIHAALVVCFFESTIGVWLAALLYVSSVIIALIGVMLIVEDTKLLDVFESKKHRSIMVPCDGVLEQLRVDLQRRLAVQAYLMSLNDMDAYGPAILRLQAEIDEFDREIARRTRFSEARAVAIRTYHS